jgi:hypothetical protein
MPSSSTEGRSAPAKQSSREIDGSPDLVDPNQSPDCPKVPAAQLAAGTFTVSCCPRHDSVLGAECACLRPVARRRARMASSCICSYRQSSLQKGVSPRYMKMSLSRPRCLAQSAHESSAGIPSSATGSASKKKQQPRDAPIVDE